MIEAMKQALEALEEACGDRCNAEYNPCHARTAITSLRQAIEQAEKQEPVAFVTGTYAGRFVVKTLNPAMVLPVNMALYTTPQPQREWVDLTDEEIAEGIKQSWVTEQAFQSAAWWAEERLKEKNT